MLCECGNRFPDNAPYCPYCGKKNMMMRSRPDSLLGFTIGPDEDPPQIVIPDAEEGGCLKKTVELVLGIVVLFLFMVFAGIAVGGGPTTFFDTLKEMWSYVDLGCIAKGIEPQGLIIYF